MRSAGAELAAICDAISKRARQELVVRHDLVDEPGARDLRRRVELAGEAHLARLGEADALHDVVRARELGHQAHAHEEHAHPRLVGSDDDVEGKDHGEPDADRDAVDRGDQRLRLAAERDPVDARGVRALLLPCRRGAT